MTGFPLGLSRFTGARRASGPGRASVDTAGKVYAATGLKPASTAVLYGNGTQIATTTVDGTGKATWTLATAPTGGTIITYDGVVVGSGGTAATPVTGPTLGALTVSPSSATVGAAYSGTISGRTIGSTLALTGAGATGLSVSGTTISGTPTTGGAVNVVETLADATGSPRTTSGAITVATGSAALALAFAPAAGTQYQTYGAGAATSNGTPPYSYSLLSGALPAGTTLAQNTGALTGTLTDLGTFAGTLRVTDATGATADAAFSVTVAAASPFALAQLPAGYIDLDATSGVTASSSLVSAWTAKAGTLALGTGVTAEQPTLVTDGWSTGIPVVRFNGVSSGNILRSSSGTFSERRWTLFAAARPNADQNAVANLKTIYESGRPSDGLSASITMHRLTNDPAQTNVYVTSYGATTFGATAGFTKGSKAILADRAATVRLGHVNGVAGASPTSTVGTTTRTQRKLGGSDDAVAQRAAIDIARMIEVDTDTLPGKAEQVANLYLLEGHLAWIYGTQASLRADHPYLSRAPVATDYRGTNQNWEQWGDSLGLGTAAQLPTALNATARGITVSNGSVGGTNSTQIRARFDANQDANGGTASGLSAADIRAKLTVFGEMFENDNFDNADTGKTQVDIATGNANLAAMVAAVETAQGVTAGQGRIIIWGQWEGNGLITRSNTAAVRARNTDLRAAYPRYFLDMHRVLANLAAPGAAYADAEAFARDAIPSGLRAGSGDSVHLSTVGYTEAAKSQVRLAAIRGWL